MLAWKRPHAVVLLGAGGLRVAHLCVISDGTDNELYILNNTRPK